MKKIFNYILSFFPTNKKEKITKYVCCFLFSHCGKYVYLIRKKRPNWQLGYLNGVGGKVEKGESCETAMIREIYEEAGVRAYIPDLVYLEEYRTDGKQVRFYAILMNKNFVPAGRTDEALQKVRWMRNAIQSWNSLHVVDNVPYLVNKGYWAIMPYIEVDKTAINTDKLFPIAESLFTNKESELKSPNIK
jgi:ADP-ribose pyrophosphatase YjhB (NUDIX family)